MMPDRSWEEIESLMEEVAVGKRSEWYVLEVAPGFFQEGGRVNFSSGSSASLYITSHSTPEYSNSMKQVEKQCIPLFRKTYTVSKYQLEERYASAGYSRPADEGKSAYGWMTALEKFKMRTFILKANNVEIMKGTNKRKKAAEQLPSDKTGIEWIWRPIIISEENTSSEHKEI
ncbi:unnamed protein product [Allacma fusca]|uniref:Uncharacterized protein n=1 Tax=Allacma fusca TaxID=39272 RepID=A0A8J2KZQ1_9HEXA|nr:unnamed protein product [Allacma fusca]